MQISKFDKVIFHVYVFLRQYSTADRNFDATFFKNMQHCEAVWENAKKISKKMNLTKDEKRILRYGVALHDIGKFPCVQAKYEGNPKKGHEKIGADFIKTSGLDWLKTEEFSQADIEILCKIIKSHRKIKHRKTNAGRKLCYIVFAADKLAHIQKSEERRKKSLRKIQGIPSKKVKKAALHIAKKGK